MIRFTNKHAPRSLNPSLYVGLAFVLLIGAGFLSACSPDIPEVGELTPTSSNNDSPAFSQASTPPPEDPDPLSITAIPLPTPDPWDGKGRVTILLLGLDYADWESSDRIGPPRSDTMILLTVDPATKTAGVLSIPRDLWVNLPGFPEPNKINTAYRFGELYKLPGGGPALAMRTVEHLLGVPINYYLQVDFSAFVRFIDEIKGVMVFIEEPMTVSIIGTNKHVNLEPGWVTLPGDIALAYARSRVTEGDDFDRAKRQRQIIMGIRERILRFDMLPTLVLNAPKLYTTISGGINTNLSLAQVIRLAWLAQQIPEENITLAAISGSEVTSAKSPDEQDIYLPIPDRIQIIVDEVFSQAAAGQDLAPDSLVLAENTRISIVNESGQPGLAEKTSIFLKDQGLNVVEAIESQETRPLTRLEDHVDDPYTLRFLIDLLKVAPSEIWIKFDPESRAEMEILLGEDWALSGILP